MSLFSPLEPSDVKRLVEAYPLCWIVSGGASKRYATPLPLLAEQDADGQVASLFGHIAYSNPQQKALEEDPRATILCMGPQGYISPELVSNPTWGPTWNYAVCRFECDLRFVPEETDAALHQLAVALEGKGPGAWSPVRMGERYHQLRKHIVAFRARVLETHARFKLGQDENAVVF
ncbi:MAG TPA: FMN-binding negative transcriptional regulator, partial [Sphingomicrobium sp.]|nr:FMN-binding negative transcriptional regulator [Sphingomicrobium sp.]